MEVTIDFDGASKAWMENKCKLPNGCYIYRCMATTLKGEPCKYKPKTNSKYCFRHQAKTQYLRSG